MVCESSSCTISRAVFDGNAEHGLSASDDGTRITVASCKFLSNKKAAAAVASGAGGSIRACVFGAVPDDHAAPGKLLLMLLLLLLLLMLLLLLTPPPQLSSSNHHTSLSKASPTAGVHLLAQAECKCRGGGS